MMIKFKIKNIVIGCFVFMAFSAINACKKYENPPQIFEQYGDGINGKSDRKVLIINVSGLAGPDLETIKPTNIVGLLKTSKYNFNVLTEGKSSNAATMASMLTGVGTSKHLINNDSYAPIIVDDDSHDAIITYPTLLSRMLDVRPEFKTVTITSDQALSKYTIHADQRILSASDVLVKDSAVNVLKDKNSRVIITDFKSVEDAGNKDGFSASVPAYKSAIETVDGYIGEMLNAMKARKNYATEDWLIIVTTNRGGSVANPKPGFIICSNPNLELEEVTKSGFNTVRFKGEKTNASVVNDNGLYNGGTSKDFSVQVQAKFNNGAYYPGFLSKGTDVHGHETTGWVLIYNGGNWELLIGGQDNKGASHSMGGPNINDGKWHTLGFTVKTVAGVRTATMYSDGIKWLERNITSSKDLSTSEPLKIGYRNQDNGGQNLDFFTADLQYFNVALDDATMQGNIALKDITKHPNYNSLIGYWPIDDGAGSVITNHAPTGYNLLLNGGAWESLGNEIPVSRERQNITSGTVSIIATVPDVAAITLYWLKVPTKSEWGLDGVGWISNFELEFIK